MASDKFVLYFDGACLPNPRGNVTIAYVLIRNGVQVAQSAAIIGTGPASDSEAAEYYALIEGLHAFTRTWASAGVTLEIRGDYIAVIRRLQRLWPRKRHVFLHELAERNIIELRRFGVVVTFQWISREQNAQCDALAKSFREERVPRTGNKNALCFDPKSAKSTDRDR